MRKKLKQKRLKKDLTHKEVAKEAQIHRAHYTNIELGKTDPSLKVMKKIKDALGIKEENIFFDNSVQDEHENGFREAN